MASGVACPAFGAIMPPALFDVARTWQRQCFGHGFAGIDWPAEYGGRGLSSAHAVVWAQECARAGVAPYMNFQGVVLACGAIRAFGTAAQKERYLAATLAADIVWCQLFSEPDAGSDLVSLATRAESIDDGWAITGQKVWSSTAQLAQYAILLARTDPDEAGHRGISFFLFDMDQPGVEVRPLQQMTGDSEFCEVFLDRAVVRPDDLLGPLHGGWAVTTAVLADERSEVGAAGVGVRRQLAALAGSERVGEPAVRHRIASLMVDGGALAHLFDRSGGAPELGPLTKLANTEFATRLTALCLDERGADGMVVGEVTEPFLYAPGMRLAGGTSEIQRNLVGERLLGLPREPKPRPT